MKKIILFLFFCILSLWQDCANAAPQFASPTRISTQTPATEKSGTCTMTCKDTGLMPQSWLWSVTSTTCGTGEYCTSKDDGGCSCRCDDDNDSCKGQTCEGKCVKRDSKGQFPKPTATAAAKSF